MQRRSCLVLMVVVCFLIACSKRQADKASPQKPSDSPSSESARAKPPAAPTAAPESAPPAAAPEVAPAPPPPPPPKPVVIPAGAVLTVRLRQPLSSKTNNQGDPFNATLAEPLTVKGKTVVSAGSSVAGTVTEAHKAGRFKGGATLDIALSSLTIGEKTYQISTMTMTQTSKGKGKRTAAMTGGGAAGGALIGGLAGGGKGVAVGALAGAGAGVVGSAVTGNRDIEIPAESAVSFQMTSSLELPPRLPIDTPQP